MASTEIDIIETRQEEFQSSRSLKAWNITTALSLIVPLLSFFSARVMNRDQNSAEDANQYGDDGNYGDYVGGNEGYGEESKAPWWWSWKENIEQELHQQVLIIFLYLYSFTVAIILSVSVNRNFNLGKLKAVRWSLVGFINYSFICAVVVGGIPDLIRDGGAELEKTGWYGQTSVLLLLTCVCQMLSSSIFVCAIGKMISKQREDLENETKTEHTYVYF